MHPHLARTLVTWLLFGTLQLAAAATSTWLVEGEIAYQARDQATSWRGVAALSEVQATFDLDDLRSLRLEARLAPAAFNSGNGLRDSMARRTVFDVAQFPEAVLQGSAAAGTTATPLLPGLATSLTLDASLTLHGVTRPLTITLQLLRSTDASGLPTVAGEASFVISLEAHGMRRPRLLGLLTDDEVLVVVQVVARPLPTPTATTQR